MEMNNRYTVVNCEVLNLRNKPSLASDIIDKIPEGTEVYIDEKYLNKYFYKVNYNFILDFCSMIKLFIMSSYK